MSNWQVCFNWMMDNEDAKRQYETVEDTKKPLLDADGKPVVDSSGATMSVHTYAISGINSGVWPLQYAAIAARPPEQRGALVEAFYKVEFWNQWYEQINSDAVAKRLFDAAVNMGSGTATRLMQKAILSVDPYTTLIDDGKLGPHTVMRINLENEAALTTAFIAQRVAQYRAIAEANPADVKYLDQWIARALK